MTHKHSPICICVRENLKETLNVKCQMSQHFLSSRHGRLILSSLQPQAFTKNLFFDKILYLNLMIEMLYAFIIAQIGV